MSLGFPIDLMFIRHRIARPSAGYPESEARYHTIAEFEEDTGRKWFGDIIDNYCDNCGYCNGECPDCLERFL